MFTGIVEELGEVRDLQVGDEGAALTIAAETVAAGLRAGDSVACNGVCLTVVETDGSSFRCDLSAETLSRTSFGTAHRGSAVNLERPLEAGGRIGGHFVLGHVDGVGRLLESRPSGEGRTLTFAFPRDLERYLVWKGSIAVDGISLTIAELAAESFSVAVIPHTLAVTNLRDLAPGDPVNLEVDILGKYFERFFRLGLTAAAPAESLERQRL
jgi:riboflavin synthase